ncbi:UDP-N-acetylglucosamine 2-epimerase [Candidatus Peregrinibacteria bacterium]|nr:UDP-N-acetylglucosamine 2-epimerase [Candidatus Peregrinibacteria bacterium]
MEKVTFNRHEFFDEAAGHRDKYVHLILIATKPDIIKQIPLYRELKRRGHCVIMGHTGQHYDENLSGGMLKEFGVQPDFNLNVRGTMYEVVSQIVGRLGYVMDELKKRGKVVIPYVHGDTTTAMAASNAGYCHAFASVHVEAGIRTLTPVFSGKWKVESGKWKVESGKWKVESGKWKGERGKWKVESGKWKVESGKFDVAGWHEYLRDRKNWERGSLEPYPEQFNTRCSEAATGIHLAPVELDREFMLGEGFPDDRIFVVGNSVVDATEEAMSRIGQSKVFERHAILAGGDFVRFCIHRRENCASERRFRAIYGAMKSLVAEGRKVLLISMIQTEAAFERFGLKEEVTALARSHPSFVYSPVWPEYADVIAAMSRAAVCATDSGSMQEEMNAMGVPCVTLRFGSDRSESILCGGNIIAPPTDTELIKKIIEFAWNNEAMRKAPKIYGKDVSKKCIDAVEKVLRHEDPFRNEEERLNM